MSVLHLFTTHPYLTQILNGFIKDSLPCAHRLGCAVFKVLDDKLDFRGAHFLLVVELCGFKGRVACIVIENDARGAYVNLGLVFLCVSYSVDHHVVAVLINKFVDNINLQVLRRIRRQARLLPFGANIHARLGGGSGHRGFNIVNHIFGEADIPQPFC